MFIRSTAQTVYYLFRYKLTDVAPYVIRFYNHLLVGCKPTRTMYRKSSGKSSFPKRKTLPACLPDFMLLLFQDDVNCFNNASKGVPAEETR